MSLVEDQHFWFVGKRLFVASLLRSIPKVNPRILDVGCGTGGMTAFLSRWGQVTGLDISPTARSYVRKRGLIVRSGSANRLPFANRKFDVVTLFDVLYHKKIDERRALAEAYRVLKTGGYLVVTDCAMPWLWGSHDEVMHAKRRYYKYELEKLVEEAGFTILRSSYIFFFTFPLFVAARALAQVIPPTHFVSLPHPVVNRILIELLKVEAALFLWVNFPIGSSVLVLGRKR